ncbi:hypothetical protein FPOAC2_03291 [Fusarium poae]|uniref:Mid2 domain-containing protein n=1 Tax=Fusarium poae TaxID=36050 RepID=A0A1B8B8P9_FUSPO|nr:hypothetical protein FPOAC1_003184 [Fusarium poae]KAG8677172.1 hypothetical protein FPOAC1_003184 [Fusarium poae]OBS29090.1 hypothetical protein FPOA_03027 [Fusarium poae]
MRFFTIYIAFVPLAIAHTRRYEALQAAPGDLMPRFFIDRSFPLAKRAGDCGSDKHNCLEVGFPDDCCDNDSYCYVNRQGDPKCCPIGSNCSSDSPCNSTAYYCTRTATTSGTTTEQRGCCDRKCPTTSLYLCPSSLGGNCCGYNSECRVGGACASTRPASRTGLLSPIPSGCTTSQHSCTIGEGCCDNDQVCTQVNGEGYCAQAVPTESDTTIIDNNDDGGKLSDGAKAGIGVGVVVGASLIIGGLTWMCLRKRRRQRSASGPSAPRHVSDPPRDGMTDISGSHARSGPTQDYFGPDPAAGPYTEQASSRVTSPGRDAAVPMHAQSPGDIAAPVEIDSTRREGSDLLSPMSSPSLYQTPLSETIDGRFELYGNDSAITPDRPLSIVPTPPQSIMGDKRPRQD